MSKPLNRRRGVWLAAAALLALSIVAQICIWLLVLPFVMWAAPSLAAGYLATPHSTRRSAATGRIRCAVF